MSPQSLRGWVERDRIGRGGGGASELTSAAREELEQLRRQNTEQWRTTETLKKAAAFFAGDSGR